MNFQLSPTFNRLYLAKPVPRIPPSHLSVLLVVQEQRNGHPSYVSHLSHSSSFQTIYLLMLIPVN